MQSPTGTRSEDEGGADDVGEAFMYTAGMEEGTPPWEAWIPSVRLELPTQTKPVVEDKDQVPLNLLRIRRLVAHYFDTELESVLIENATNGHVYTVSSDSQLRAALTRIQRSREDDPLFHRELVSAFIHLAGRSSFLPCAENSVTSDWRRLFLKQLPRWKKAKVDLLYFPPATSTVARKLHAATSVCFTTLAEVSGEIRNTWFKELERSLDTPDLGMLKSTNQTPISKVLNISWSAAHFPSIHPLIAIYGGPSLAGIISNAICVVEKPPAMPSLRGSEMPSKSSGGTEPAVFPVSKQVADLYEGLQESPTLSFEARRGALATVALLAANPNNVDLLAEHFRLMDVVEHLVIEFRKLYITIEKETRKVLSVDLSLLISKLRITGPGAMEREAPSLVLLQDPLRRLLQVHKHMAWVIATLVSHRRGRAFVADNMKRLLRLNGPPARAVQLEALLWLLRDFHDQVVDFFLRTVPAADDLAVMPPQESLFSPLALFFAAIAAGTSGERKDVALLLRVLVETPDCVHRLSCYAFLRHIVST